MTEDPRQGEKEEIDNQLSSFLKRIKLREEEHHRICDRTNRLLSRQSELEQMLFIHDEIVKHQGRLTESQVYELTHREADDQLAVRCDEVLSMEEQGVLGRRVMSRILEVTYAAIEAFRQFREYYRVNYIRFKQKCLKLVNQGVCRPSIAVTMGSKYLGNKMQIEHQRLSQAIACLQITNYQPFQHLRSTYYEVLSRKQTSFAIRKEVTPTENESPTSRNERKFWRRDTVNPQKQPRTELKLRVFKGKGAKEQQKLKQKHKKAEAKRLKKYITNIHQVMQICKEEVLDDMAPTNKEWQSKRLLGGLLTRNKSNQLHISTFLERESFYNDAISKPLPSPRIISLNKCISLEKELITKKQSQEEQQFMHSSFTSKEMRLQDLSKKSSMSVPRRQSMRAVPLSGNSRSVYKPVRATINNIEQAGQKRKNKQIFSSHRQINQQHLIEFNTKDSIKLPKARFPQIPVRMTSKKSLKNQEQSPLRTKLEIKPSSNYFDEIERRIVKFCESKKNVI